MRVDPYLYFNGRCEEAIEFYRRALGAEVAQLTRNRDNPGAQSPPDSGDKVMHADLRIGETKVLASDGQSQGDTNFKGFSLSLTATSDKEADRLFEALSDGGAVKLPMMSTPFASRFAMVADRFGVLWTIASHQQASA